ncbi:flippase-like domain-containing protein [Thermodesulfobacteriota bacterium]
MMRRTAYLLAGAGIVLVISLIVKEGATEIIAVLSMAGWQILWIAGYRFVTIAADTLGWSGLIGDNSQSRLPYLFWARWVSESFNTLLPAAQVGGHFVRAGLICRRGVTGSEAGATVVVDFTMGLTTQVIFTFMGISLLFVQYGNGNQQAGLAIGLAFGVFLLLAFFLSQRLGLFSFAARFFNRFIRDRELIDLVGGAKTLDQKISELYKKRREVFVCGSWRFISWLTKAGESWLTLYLLGFPVTIQEALILESLSAAARSAAFAIPGALGVQEGGILLIGTLIGIKPEVALALALVKRGRELMIGIPGLMTWSAAEAGYRSNLLQ